MIMSINNKIFQPITIYTALVISFYLFINSPLFSKIVLVLIFISALFMAINTFKEKNSSQRVKNTLFELMYCVLVYITMKYGSRYIGNVYSSLLVVIEYLIYINIVNPKLMNRQIFTSIKK